MTLNIEELRELAEEAAELEDQTEVSEGGDFEVPPAGPAVARLVGYVELGKHKRPPYAGKPKSDADKVKITFELLGKNHVREIEVDGKKRTIANRITITLDKILNDKANFSKLFEAMRYGRDIKNMAQMIGEAFRVTVVHNVVKGKEGKKDRTYANLRDNNGWTISAPRSEVMDEETGLPTGEFKTLPVPEAVGEYQLFIWNKPTKETWDSIHIEGTREVEDAEGNKTQKSKNFLQELAKSAVDFEGSPLYHMLGGVDDLPEIQAATEAAEAASPKTEKKKEAKKETKKEEPKEEEATAETPKEEKKQAEADADAAALAELGLV